LIGRFSSIWGFDDIFKGLHRIGFLFFS